MAPSEEPCTAGRYLYTDIYTDRYSIRRRGRVAPSEEPYTAGRYHLYTYTYIYIDIKEKRLGQVAPSGGLVLYSRHNNI